MRKLFLLLLFLLCCKLEPAARPIELDIDPSLRRPASLAMKRWNRWAGCQVFIEGISGRSWGVIPGNGKLGVASTFYKIRVVAINGVATEQCQYEAMAHELGHMIDAEAGDDPPPHSDNIMSEDWRCTYVNEPRSIWPPSNLSRAKARCVP